MLPERSVDLVGSVVEVEALEFDCAVVAVVAAAAASLWLELELVLAPALVGRRFEGRLWSFDSHFYSDSEP